MHEASLYERNCFLTLTYDDDHVPAGGSLQYRDFQLFMKRLRRAHPQVRIRFYMCGEYGEQLSRPHYHACLFNFDFADKVPLTSQLDRSPELERLWPYGLSSIGEVTFESAAYVARYIVDKITGDQAVDHYQGLEPEFSRMSLKPGIGAIWLERFSSDVFPRGKVVTRGFESPAPRYYNQWFAARDVDAYERLRFAREIDQRARAWDNTDDRLAVRKEVAIARLNFRSSRSAI